MKRIYKYNGKYYKKIHELPNGDFMWVPMKKVLWFYVQDGSKSMFRLDDEGFELVR